MRSDITGTAGKPADLSKKKVKEMSIEDVIRTPEFSANLTDRLEGLLRLRREARRIAENKRMSLKSHPIDRLVNGEMYSAEKFKRTYMECLNKENKTYSATVRYFIISVGNEVFNRTMVKLLDDEKERDKRDGDDKQ